jgi:hypothetical protein
VSVKDKYKRPKPDQDPPRKKGNSDVISTIVNNETVNTAIQETVSTARNVKKETFELDADLHKKLRTFAVLNDTTMVDVVEKALNEYLGRMDNK